MKNFLSYLLLLILLISCNKLASKKENLSIDTLQHKKQDPNTIFTKGTVLSVKKELIMPSDYLTTAMTVKTIKNDTLVFLDMNGFEKLVGQEIAIKYKLKTGEKLLVCFDCNSFSEKVVNYDISSFTSEVQFEKLRLKKYVPDEYIEPASIYVMTNEEGNSANYLTNNNKIISDSIKMATSFFNYGIVTMLHPALQNRKELQKLLEQ